MTRDLTTTEAAGLIDVGVRTITKAIRDGYLSAYKVPGSKHRRITREALRAYCQRYDIPMRPER